MRKVIIIILVLVFGYSVSCDQSEFGKDEILGEWITVFYCDSCYVFDFKPNNDLLLRDTYSDEIIVFWYKLMKDDKIMIELDAEKSEYPLIFHSYDSIEIKNFKIIDPFQANSTFLKRIKK